MIKVRNFLIIGVTTLVYTIAQLPYLYYCLETYAITNTLSGLTLVKYARFTFIILQTSCFINPVIYYLTNKGFRGYTHWFLRGVVRGEVCSAPPRLPSPASPARLPRLQCKTQKGVVSEAGGGLYCNEFVHGGNLKDSSIC